ncbi:hypothetical protein AVEN_199863-1 [Araneus ventricosus]|uniref:Uncharacterized protein n=1 Tax=Araneus ventricosus TaxID=182803 RepID=A0A4Y2M860_ARAVE|nr:hypothetical protein AVEN_199863-1 [Araneus ventricosus]
MDIFASTNIHTAVPEHLPGRKDRLCCQSGFGPCNLLFEEGPAGERDENPRISIGPRRQVRKMVSQSGIRDLQSSEFEEGQLLGGENENSC